MQKNINPKIILEAIFIIFSIIFLSSNTIYAHCDTLDGPVVTAARKALDTNNVKLVLIWVQKKDETEITKAFEKTLEVRKLNSRAKELADMYFFETLVRIHRAGEGASYTGLKPAGLDVGPAIPAADKALETGKSDQIIKLLQDAIIEGVNKTFTKAFSLKNYRENDVDVGREYIEAYVIYLHYIEGLYESAKNPSTGEHAETDKTSGHAD
jgi:hypothetical protein